MSHDTEYTRCDRCGGIAYRGRPGWASDARPWLHLNTTTAGTTHLVEPTTITTTKDEA